MDAIGGYLELELREGQHFHAKALRLNTARNCLEYILRVRQYTKVYIPYYTCEAVLEPFNKLGIQYEFYHINKLLEPVSLPVLADSEALLYTNYFGLKQSCVNQLAAIYGNRLIVDNAQAFYETPVEGIDTFYSARKFFGVSDGAYLYTDACLSDFKIEKDFSYDRMVHLLKRIDLGPEAGYADFRQTEEELCGQGIKYMSNITENILKGIDYEAIAQKRKANYQILDASLSDTNRLRLPISDASVPMVYPYLTDNITLKLKLIDYKIFVPTYWPNVVEWCKPSDWELQMVQSCLFLPVDQRYGSKNWCEKILEVILN